MSREATEASSSANTLQLAVLYIKAPVKTTVHYNYWRAAHCKRTADKTEQWWVDEENSTAMENVSLSTDTWNNSTTSWLEDEGDGLKANIFQIRHLTFKVIYIIMATVGVLGNLFVIIIFIFFIKITDKVFLSFFTSLKIYKFSF